MRILIVEKAIWLHKMQSTLSTVESGTAVARK
jgi:hypothetical protein